MKYRCVAPAIQASAAVSLRTPAGNGVGNSTSSARGSQGKGTRTFANGNVYVGKRIRPSSHGWLVYCPAAQRATPRPPFSFNKEAAQLELIQSFLALLFFALGADQPGEFVLGEMQGSGRLTMACGDTYTGQFKANRLHGTGTYVFADGAVYDGQFADHKMHGTGTMAYANGDRCG